MSTTTTTTTTTSTRSFLQQQQFKMSTNNNINTNSNTHSQNEFDLLDIFSTDMDFEQAYNMYSTLQQKNALGSFEQLQKVQQLNQQYSSTLSNPIPTSNIHQFPDQFAYERAHILNGPHNLQPQQQQQQQYQQHQQGFVNNYVNKNYSFNDPNIQNLQDEDEIDDDFDQFFTNTESNALEKFLDNLANPISTGNPLQFYNNSTNGGSSLHNNHEIDFNFEMHTMKVPQHLKPRSQSNIDNSNQLPIPLPPSGPIQQVVPPPQDHIQLKKELTEAFTNPSISTFNQLPSPKDFHTHNNNNNNNNNNNDPILTNTNTTMTKKTKQLITPPTSGDELRKRNSDDESDEEEDEDDDNDEQEEKQDNKDKTRNKPLKKRRRSSNKPLLSIEQKRLNHSNSEQKRRQLCKLAYERCLELIIDLDAFNKLPELNENERKSKRARVNKDGLPNLSKHNALIRISNEMILIKSMNENLKKFIENN